MLHKNDFTNEPELTNREMEVLEHIAQGLSTKEAAKHLDIAPRTVDRHIENIRLKLRAKNRSNMIACAVMHGLLNINGPKVTEPDSC
ncbi:LuxR C-terminal-related transcriptional regulator [Sphingorhabdus arenilitoris]|uniref:LuxR C-terminal-related transcriptional regulator n=1 Tax=Sphingorhabdus arenilitoris TaxID=1490041 RepID=A0ABV8RE73_9SPHN